LAALEKYDRVKPGRPIIFLILPVLILIGAAISLIFLYEREAPQISLETEITKVGRSKNLELVFADGKRGLRSVEVWLVQGEQQVKVFEKSYASQGVLGLSGPERAQEAFELTPAELKFKDGEAELLVKARDYSWWGWRQGNLAEVAFPAGLDTQPPLIRIVDSTRYIIAGGAGAVTYKINEAVAEHGVLLNGFYHRGFSLPGKEEGDYGAVLALPHDAKIIEQSLVRAVDQAGNETRVPFSMVKRKSTKKEDRIDISDNFLSQKLPEFVSYYPELVGKTPLEQFLEINGRIRQENDAKILEVCSKSKPERMWDGRFQHLARSSRRAGYAEYRTYYYQGKAIDHQVHLGIDLASTSQAPVKSAAAGEVVFADYLGIYGNMVIIDHGFGVFTLYSHLSQIQSAVGSPVTQETVIGLTGYTGMAGGDHLHFSVLVNGVFVNPLEWWDTQWLTQNILNYL
jgi:hypothetical protein